MEKFLVVFFGVGNTLFQVVARVGGNDFARMDIVCAMF
jgi:hypothetical protein